MNDCIFCKIATGEIKSDFLYEDEQVVAFRDINPQAPWHILIIPRQHYQSIKELNQEDQIGHLFSAAKKIAEKFGFRSHRLVVNTGLEAGQAVLHLHLHLLSGREMKWPPG